MHTKACLKQTIVQAKKKQQQRSHKIVYDTDVTVYSVHVSRVKLFPLFSFIFKFLISLSHTKHMLLFAPLSVLLKNRNYQL